MSQISDNIDDIKQNENFQNINASNNNNDEDNNKYNLLIFSKLQSEKELSRINQIDIESRWKKVLSQNKVEEIKRDATHVMKDMQKEVALCDKTIHLLYDAFDGADDQFHKANSVHMDSLQTLIDLFEEQLLSLESEFEINLYKVLKQFQMERQCIAAQHESNNFQIMDKTTAMEMEKQILVQEENNTQQQVINEIRNKNLEQINGVRVVLESKIEDLEDSADVAHNEYLQQTDSKSIEFQTLKEKEGKDRKEINRRINQINHLQGILQRIKVEHDRSSGDHQEQYNNLLNRKLNAINHYHAWKTKLNKIRNYHRQEMIDTTKIANASKKKLQEQCGLVNRILRLHSLCQSLETEKEINQMISSCHLNEPNVSIKEESLRIIDEYKNKLNDKTIHSGSSGKRVSFKSNNINQRKVRLEKYNGNNNHNEDWNFLETFWKRFNKVQIEVLTLEKTVTKLNKEKIYFEVCVCMLKNCTHLSYLFFSNK